MEASVCEMRIEQDDGRRRCVDCQSPAERCVAQTRENTGNMQDTRAANVNRAAAPSASANQNVAQYLVQPKFNLLEVQPWIVT
ncbi:hypothetical protein J6590_004238 [Homalodisca vitripennis]|nr:hypothetical protein J6590_004238 [Homalodisca vitripennis]